VTIFIILNSKSIRKFIILQKTLLIFCDVFFIHLFNEIGSRSTMGQSSILSLSNRRRRPSWPHSAMKSTQRKKLKVPWKSIFTSVPFIGLMITDSSNTWGLWTLSTNGPTYMKYMLGVDIRTNGLLSALPLLCRYFGGLVHSPLVDLLLRKKYVSTVWVRRIFNSISQCGPACAMLVLFLLT
jgi:hypothetical protein